MTILPSCDNRQQAVPVENPSPVLRNPSALAGELQRRINPIEDVPPPPPELKPFHAVDGYFSLPIRFTQMKLAAVDWEVAAYMSRRMGMSGHPCIWAMGRKLKDVARQIATDLKRSLRAVELALTKFRKAKAISFERRFWRGFDHLFVHLAWALRPFTEWQQPHKAHPALRLPGIPGAGLCAGTDSTAVEALILGPESAEVCAPYPGGARSCASAGSGANPCVTDSPQQPPGADPCAPEVVTAASFEVESPPTEGARTDVDVKAFEVKDLTSTSERAVDPAVNPRPHRDLTTAEIHAQLAIPAYRRNPWVYSPLLRELTARGESWPKGMGTASLLDPEAQPSVAALAPPVRYAPPPVEPRPAPSPTLEQELSKLEGSGDLVTARRLAEWCCKTIGDNWETPASANFHLRNLRLVAEPDETKRLPAKVVNSALKDFREGRAQNPLKAFVGTINRWLDKAGLRKPTARPNRPSRPQKRSGYAQDLAAAYQC